MLGFTNTFSFAKKAIVYILKPIGKSKDRGKMYVILKSGKIPLTKNVFKWKDKEYILNTDNCILKKHTPILYYDVEKTQPMTFFSKSKIDSAEFQTIVETRIWNKVLSKKSETWLLLALVIAIVLLFGFSIYSMWTIDRLNQRIITLISNVTNSTSIVK